MCVVWLAVIVDTVVSFVMLARFVSQVWREFEEVGVEAGRVAIGMGMFPCRVRVAWEGEDGGEGLGR